MRPEEKIEKEFVAECKKRNILQCKFEVDGFRGAPDRMVFLPDGMVFFIEFKRPGGGKVSQHQAKFLARLDSLGFKTLLTCCWEEPIEWIEDYIQ